MNAEIDRCNKDNKKNKLQPHPYSQRCKYDNLQLQGPQQSWSNAEFNLINLEQTEQNMAIYFCNNYVNLTCEKQCKYKILWSSAPWVPLEITTGANSL